MNIEYDTSDWEKICTAGLVSAIAIGVMLYLFFMALDMQLQNKHAECTQDQLLKIQGRPG